MKAADRGVKVRLLMDDPSYKANDPVIAALDAHANVEIGLFNPFTSRRWSRLTSFSISAGSTAACTTS